MAAWSKGKFQQLEREFAASPEKQILITKIDRKSIQGVVNNGGAALRIKAFSGSIEIRKK